MLLGVVLLGSLVQVRAAGIEVIRGITLIGKIRVIRDLRAMDFLVVSHTFAQGYG